MKNNLLLFTLLLTLFSCKRDSVQSTHEKDLKTMTLNQALGSKDLNASLAASNTVTKTINWSDIPSGTPFCAAAPFSVSGVTFLATHGYMEYDNANGASNLLMSFDHTDYLYGSGFAIQYPFKKGKSYKISLVISGPAEKPGQSLKWPATLEAQLTNSITQSSTFCDYRAPNMAFGDDKPKFDFKVGEKPYGTKSIEFTPDQCYEYLWFSLQSKRNDNELGVAAYVPLYKSMTIEETSILEINGPAMTCSNTQGDFNITASGYPISDQFNWTVTGGLQIIGSNVGNSVRVSTNGKGGTISIGTGGCEAMAVRTIDPSPAPTKVYGAIETGQTYGGNSYNYYVGEVPGVTSYRWTTSYGTIVSGQGTSNVQISFPRLTGTASMGYRLSLTTTNTCGETSVLNANGVVKPCNNCPIN